MPGLVLVTAPSVEPVTIEDLKAHSRITADAEDGLLERLLLTARQVYEKQQSRALLTQTWDWSLDCFPRGSLVLQVPLSPLQSVTSITYYDPENTPTVWPSTEYVVDTAGGRIAIPIWGSWPTAQLRSVNGVVVRFVAGYATVPLLQDAEADVQAELLELAALLYENRETGMAQTRGSFAPYA